MTSPVANMEWGWYILTMDIREIRKIAERFTPEEIEGCITRQIETGKNICIESEATDKIVNELSKAVFIRELMEQGMTLADSLRELARRMRRLQEGSEE